ncbi:MAG: lipoprotein-releasing system transmembrane subunit LolC [Candidatus Pelagibacter sp. TMED196]|nr:MAG: lipoprotein-releasing system transmembrane subunit LolC [Candidatus Pelagibacter sp. TMED196]
MFTDVEKLITSRNLKPKKKEGFLKIISIFSFLGIMLGVAVLIIVMSVMNGFRTELTNKILGFNSHITIKPYSTNITESYYNVISNNYNNFNIIKTFNGEAVILNNNSAKGVLLRGVDPKKISNIDLFNKNIIDGQITNFKTGTIVIGKYLAIELGVVVGDVINIMSSSSMTTPLGNIPRQSSFKITAVFSSGLYEFDRSVSFLHLNDSLSFFGKDTDNISLEIFLNEPLNAYKYKNEIQNINPNYYVSTWADQNKSFFSALKVERNVMFLILTLIIVVAAFNIVSGLTILIKNKTKEIAILKSLGLSKKSIIKSFFLTGFIIGLTATITGLILGVLFSLNIESIRLFLSNTFNLQIFPEDVYFLTEMPSEISLSSIIIISGFSLVTSIFASLFPSLAVTKIEPIKALKYD